MRERLSVCRGTVPTPTTGRYKDYNVWKYYSGQGSYYPDLMVMGMTDVVTENFRARQLAGEIINNPMWKFLFSIQQGKVGLGAEGQCASYVILEPEAVIPPLWAPTGASWSDEVDALCAGYSSESSVAQAKAWANVDVSEIQGLASLGELPETVKMLIDAMKSFVELTIAAKRGDFGKILKSAKKAGFTIDGLSNIWLGYRYGIRPIMGDIKNLLSAVAADLDKGMRYTSRGKNVILNQKSTQTGTFMRCPHSVDYPRGVLANTTTQSSRTFRAGVLVEIDRNIDALTAIWGLDSPVEAAWELIPFSFILDWFLNIGDVISAAFLNPGLSPLSSWVTEQISWSQSSIATAVHYTDSSTSCWYKTKRPYLKSSASSCFTNVVTTVARRVPLAERYQLPVINLKLDWYKFTDLILIARKLI